MCKCICLINIHFQCTKLQALSSITFDIVSATNHLANEDLNNQVKLGKTAAICCYHEMITESTTLATWSQTSYKKNHTYGNISKQNKTEPLVKKQNIKNKNIYHNEINWQLELLTQNIYI